MAQLVPLVLAQPGSPGRGPLNGCMRACVIVLSGRDVPATSRNAAAERQHQQLQRTEHPRRHHDQRQVPAAPATDKSTALDSVTEQPHLHEQQQQQRRQRPPVTAKPAVARKPPRPSPNRVDDSGPSVDTAAVQHSCATSPSSTLSPSDDTVTQACETADATGHTYNDASSAPDLPSDPADAETVAVDTENHRQCRQQPVPPVPPARQRHQRRSQPPTHDTGATHLRSSLISVYSPPQKKWLPNWD